MIYSSYHVLPQKSKVIKPLGNFNGDVNKSPSNWV
jgi:hypothetical protein